MSANDHDELLKRVRELEEENARLRRGRGEPPKKITCEEGEYQGFPVLTFDGTFRPFSLGLKKLRAVIACKEQVEAFLQKHKDDTRSVRAGGNDEKDLQI